MTSQNVKKVVGSEECELPDLGIIFSYTALLAPEFI